VDACGGASAVVFEGELAFEGVENGLDPLAYAVKLSEAGFLVFAVGADQLRFELVADEFLKRDSARATADSLRRPPSRGARVGSRRALGRDGIRISTPPKTARTGRHE